MFSACITLRLTFAAAGSVAMSFKSYTADSRSFKSLQRGTTHYVPQFNDAHAMAPVASSNAVVAALKAKTRLMHDLESVSCASVRVAIGL